MRHLKIWQSWKSRKSWFSSSCSSQNTVLKLQNRVLRAIAGWKSWFSGFSWFSYFGVSHGASNREKRYPEYLNLNEVWHVTRLSISSGGNSRLMRNEFRDFTKLIKMMVKILLKSGRCSRRSSRGGVLFTLSKTRTSEKETKWMATPRARKNINRMTKNAVTTRSP